VRGLSGYSKLTRRELIRLLQREHRELMDIVFPSDKYGDSESLIHFLRR